MIAGSRAASLLSVIVWMASTAIVVDTNAGMLSRYGLAAVTPDGSHVAVYRAIDGAAEYSCGLAEAKSKLTSKEPNPSVPDLLKVRARCSTRADGSFSPSDHWRWSARTPAVTSLVEFDAEPKSLSATARISRHHDTRLNRLELWDGGEWLTFRAEETTAITEVPLEQRYGAPDTSRKGTWIAVTGVVRGPRSVFLRLAHHDSLTSWDELVVVPHAELSRSALVARFERARLGARAASHLLRQQRAQQTGVFEVRATTARRRAAERALRADAVRAAVHLWEQAAAFQSLDQSDLHSTLWLLAWLEAPTRRLEALRLFRSFRDRDAVGAFGLLVSLQRDPDTAALARYLEKARDPLHNLPEVAGHTLTDAELASLTNDQIRWLHLAQWAAQGCYRFEDPAIESYFSQFPWYSPIPKDRWRTQRTRPFMKNPDAPLLRMLRSSIPADARKESLEAILRAEKARGLEPPSL